MAAEKEQNKNQICDALVFTQLIWLNDTKRAFQEEETRASYKPGPLTGVPLTTKERHRHPLADEENWLGG